MPNIRRMRLGASPGAESDRRAQAIVACALTCPDVASEKWTRSAGVADPRQLF